MEEEDQRKSLTEVDAVAATGQQKIKQANNVELYL